MMYRLSRWPLTLLATRGTAVKVTVMPIRKIHRQCVAVYGVGSDPIEGRFASRDMLRTHGLNLQDQSLIRRQIQGLVRNDDFAIEMRADGHDGTSPFQYRRNGAVFQEANETVTRP